jgi:hypothetical protein
MHSCLTVDFTGSTPVVAQVHRCDPTIMCEPHGDAAPRQARATTSRMTGVVSSVDPVVLIRLNASASHPFPALTPGGGDIAYRGDIVVDRATRSVRVDLMVQLFPAFEGYASINEGPAAILFRQAPPPGVTELRLPPGPQRRIRSSLQDGNGDGVFDGAIAQGHGEHVSSIHHGETRSRES